MWANPSVALFQVLPFDAGILRYLRYGNRIFAIDQQHLEIIVIRATLGYRITAFQADIPHPCGMREDDYLIFQAGIYHFAATVGNSYT
jgi:hypothetical protein